MKKFIELETVSPVECEKGKLCGVSLDTVAVNVDSIAWIESFKFFYPSKTNKDKVYLFSVHIKKNDTAVKRLESCQVFHNKPLWESKYLNIEFEDLIRYKDLVDENFESFSFFEGVRIHLYPNSTPYPYKNGKPFYVVKSFGELLQELNQ
ncbi:hypothetical protein B0187_01310 [Haemophilus paracuniculus]|uniref:Uncharacterized protein n=1 Tax=Haemophilus paracuniculus TaxID=734 RepID=A0A1T0AV26_9PAST|nr:hypothetical protein [Haemophilus paracuniculus]OOS00571.1 hypothetical protein B0187_01310 [Haemophilus paracuniculus]